VPDADAGTLGDLVERHRERALGEGRARSREDLLPVAFRVAAERRPPVEVADRGVVAAV
jgi:hypothetical protein